MSFLLNKVNDYVVPNTGHTGSFDEDQWYQISDNTKIDNAIVLLGNGLTLSIVQNKLYVLSNRSEGETIIQTYSSLVGSFYLRYYVDGVKSTGTGEITKKLDYTWLGNIQNTFTEVDNLPTATAAPSTYKFPAGAPADNSYTAISGIYMGTSATPPQGLPSGSVYIYYGADSGSGSSSSDS